MGIVLVFIAAASAVGGGFLAAAHVRERRARSDLRASQDALKRARRAWWSLAGVSARRYGLLALVALAGFAWWRGR